MALFEKIIELLVAIFNAISRKKDTQNVKVELLEGIVSEAAKWLGVHETESVNVFRKAVDGHAAGEPWCAAFVQYCCAAVSQRVGAEISLVPSELCYDIWQKTPKKYRLSKPIPGCVVVWNYPGTTRGHIGIVKFVSKDSLHTIEGNTSDPEKKESVNGVHLKLRGISGTPGMKILGFLTPFK